MGGHGKERLWKTENGKYLCIGPLKSGSIEGKTVKSSCGKNELAPKVPVYGPLKGDLTGEKTAA